MDERIRFVLACEDGIFSVSELCARFDISRKTGYKWLERYAATGVNGLANQSRAPKTTPHKLRDCVAEAIIQARRDHPDWGARKLLVWLASHRPELADQLPAASTANAVLAGAGLLTPQRGRRRYKHPGGAGLSTTAPNDVWTADFKGQFWLGNGQICYPLTVADGHTRYLLGCTGLSSVEQVGVIPIFTALFNQFGLPQAIRTDNGVPFATSALAGLSKLNVYWLKQGIAHQRIASGRPEQNGRHERMHRTLKAKTTRPAEADIAAQQARFDAFGQEYNTERRHEALGMQVPATLYTRSPRRLPAQESEPNYPSHMQIRWVSNAGTFRFKRHQVFLYRPLIHEYIALEETADGIWSIYFYDVVVARLDERDGRLFY
jgi:transposase InsO family protein